MNELEVLKKKGEEHYREICPHKIEGKEHPYVCPCTKAAHIWAFRECFIPEDYCNLTLDNFDGEVNSEKVLSPNVVLKAKQAFGKYCFGTKDIEDYDPKDMKWLDKSIMDNRREHGHSLVIYGNPYRCVQVPTSSSTFGKSNVKAFKRPIGCTMLASLVLREAINLRHRPGHEGDSYYFEKAFSLLVDRLLRQATGDKS